MAVVARGVPCSRSWCWDSAQKFFQKGGRLSVSLAQEGGGRGVNFIPVANCLFFPCGNTGMLPARILSFPVGRYIQV